MTILRPTTFSFQPQQARFFLLVELLEPGVPCQHLLGPLFRGPRQSVNIISVKTTLRDAADTQRPILPDTYLEAARIVDAQCLTVSFPCDTSNTFSRPSVRSQFIAVTRAYPSRGTMRSQGRPSRRQEASSSLRGRLAAEPLGRSFVRSPAGMRRNAKSFWSVDQLLVAMSQQSSPRPHRWRFAVAESVQKSGAFFRS